MCPEFPIAFQYHHFPKKKKNPEQTKKTTQLQEEVNCNRAAVGSKQNNPLLAFYLFPTTFI